ncbi:hypothetical protein [Providencia manganoxydans]
MTTQLHYISPPSSASNSAFLASSSACFSAASFANRSAYTYIETPMAA